MKATALVLLGGLALTAVFVLKEPKERSGPYVPARDDEVLAEVPVGTPRPSAELTADEAADRAQLLIVEARRAGGDPRLLGRAQATLARWWNDPAPPPRVRLLRATLKQSFHDFEGALADLEPLDEPQAWLTRATVLNVLARYDEALQACERLEGTVAAVCRAQVWGVTGKTKDALALLDAQRPAPEELAWVLSVRGELSRWSGDDARAEADLAKALSLDPTDTYSRLVLAQLLLDNGKPERAAKLFEGRAVNDSELLLWVLAAPTEERRAELDARVAANRLRGETLHRREESRYALLLEGDVQRALELAVANWAVQKEPADARVLLEAAAAAKDAKAAAPVVEWLKRTGFEEPRVKALARQVAP